MSYKPGDPFTEFFEVYDSTGTLAAYDSLTSASLRHNGTIDGTVTVTVTAADDTGEYVATGTIPSGYGAGDRIHLRIKPVVGGKTQIVNIFLGVLDKRVADIFGNETLIDNFNQVFNNGDALTTKTIDTLGSNESGTGDTIVNHNTGGTDNMQFVTAGGAGIAGDVQAFVASEYTANPATAVVRGQARTGDDGRWLTNMMLTSGTAYTFVFSAPGYQVSTQTVTV